MMPAVGSYSPVVQLVERRTVNPYVTGSSPVGGANKSLQRAPHFTPFTSKTR